MTEDEIKLVQPIIDMVSEMLSGQTCEDFTLPNTPSSLALWKKINAWSDPNDDDEWTLIDTSNEETLTFHDSVVFRYLVHCAISN